MLALSTCIQSPPQEQYIEKFTRIGLIGLKYRYMVVTATFWYLAGTPHNSGRPLS